jgi:hypothetical protein
MLYVQLITLMMLLYDNIVKISLRKLLEKIRSSFYAVFGTYYGVEESPLYRYRDVCSAMRIDIWFRFRLGLLVRK